MPISPALSPAVLVMALAVAAGALVTLLTIGRLRVSFYTRVSKDAIEFGLENFDALSNRRGFITRDSLYAVLKTSTQQRDEIMFLYDYISHFGRPLKEFEMVTDSLSGRLPATVTVWGMSRAHLQNARVIVSPWLGCVKVLPK
jgi:hypothetical protein